MKIRWKINLISGKNKIDSGEENPPARLGRDLGKNRFVARINLIGGKENLSFGGILLSKQSPKLT